MRIVRDLMMAALMVASLSAAAQHKRKVIIEFYLNLAAALTVIRRLVNRARRLYRWPARPTTRRLH